MERRSRHLGFLRLALGDLLACLFGLRFKQLIHQKYEHQKKQLINRFTIHALILSHRRTISWVLSLSLSSIAQYSSLVGQS